MDLLKFIYLLVSIEYVSNTHKAERDFEIRVPSQIAFYGNPSNGLGYSFDPFLIVDLASLIVIGFLMHSCDCFGLSYSCFFLEKLQFILSKLIVFFNSKIKVLIFTIHLHKVLIFFFQFYQYYPKIPILPIFFINKKINLWV
jgi:hypothetical protein